MWKGIDVSDNQGRDRLGAGGAAKVSLQSCAVSADQARQTISLLQIWRDRQKHNIPVSVYKYTYAATQDAARQEAQQVVELLRSHHLTGTMVWWDVEDRDVLRPLGPES